MELNNCARLSLHLPPILQLFEGQSHGVTDPMRVAYAIFSTPQEAPFLSICLYLTNTST